MVTNLTRPNPELNRKSYYSARCVSWIKLAVNMFDGEKIRIIESMPEGDAIVVIWLKLLTMAGKTNDNGLVYLSEGIPYSEDNLAIILNKPVTTVQLALAMLKRYGLIGKDDAGIRILNWEGQQNTEALERIRENQRIASANYRQRKRKTKLITQGKDRSYDASYNVITQNKRENKKKINNTFSDTRKTEDTLLLLRENVPQNTTSVRAATLDASQHVHNASGCVQMHPTNLAKGVCE